MYELIIKVESLPDAMCRLVKQHRPWTETVDVKLRQNVDIPSGTRGARGFRHIPGRNVEMGSWGGPNPYTSAPAPIMLAPEGFAVIGADGYERARWRALVCGPRAFVTATCQCSTVAQIVEGERILCSGHEARWSVFLDWRRQHFGVGHVPLSRDEGMALAGLALRSAYRGPFFLRWNLGLYDGCNELVQALATKGLVKVASNGAVRTTADGKQRRAELPIQIRQLV